MGVWIWTERERNAVARYDFERKASRFYMPPWDLLPTVARAQRIEAEPFRAMPASSFTAAEVRIMDERERERIRRFTYGCPLGKMQA